MSLGVAIPSESGALPVKADIKHTIHKFVGPFDGYLPWIGQPNTVPMLPATPS